MALSDVKIRKAKAQEKPYMMYDSLGLFVLVKPNGSKLWREKSALSRTVPIQMYLSKMRAKNAM